MKDPSRTNQELPEEISILKQRIKELEKSESDYKQVEEALQRSMKEALRLAKENEIVAEIGRVISSTISIEEIYKAFSEKVRELISFDRIVINLIDPEQGTVSCQYHEGIFVSGRQGGDVLPSEGTATEQIRRTGKGFIIQSESAIEIEKEYPGLQPELQHGIRSFLTVPLISKDRVIGGLALRSRKSGAYTDRDLRLAGNIANQIAGAISNAQLFIERKRMEEEIREMSLLDLLTNLYNRRGFMTLAEQQMKTADRSRRTMSLTFIDCDGLKWINDTLGHKEGDNALIDTANVLRETVRKSDIVARLGGDEFAVLAIDVMDINPEDFPKRLQQNIDAYNAKNVRPYKLAMSWGTAVYDPACSLSLDELMSSADERMYAQKKAKPNHMNYNR